MTDDLQAKLSAAEHRAVAAEGRAEHASGVAALATRRCDELERRVAACTAVNADDMNTIAQLGLAKEEAEAALASANALNERLVALVNSTPCYGCSVRYGDASYDGIRLSKGCVTCRPARALLADMDGSNEAS